jgi:AcrR family transcriptional regulator
MAAETRDKILDAAARLFAASDSGGASLRAIARAAGVNSALIHYHFGSRKGLFEAVILRALKPVQARRRALLETLRSKRSVSAEELAGLFVRPLIPGPLDGSDFDDRQDPESDATDLRLLARAFADHRPLVQDLTLKHFGSLMYGFGDVVGAALSELPDDLKQRRMRFCVQAALETLSGPEMEFARAEGPAACEALVEDLIAFLAGGLDAPAQIS